MPLLTKTPLGRPRARTGTAFHPRCYWATPSICAHSGAPVQYLKTACARRASAEKTYAPQIPGKSPVKSPQKTPVNIQFLKIAPPSICWEFLRTKRKKLGVAAVPRAQAELTHAALGVGSYTLDPWLRRVSAAP